MSLSSRLIFHPPASQLAQNLKTKNMTTHKNVVKIYIVFVYATLTFTFIVVFVHWIVRMCVNFHLALRTIHFSTWRLNNNNNEKTFFFSEHFCYIHYVHCIWKLKWNNLLVWLPVLFLFIYCIFFSFVRSFCLSFSLIILFVLLKHTIPWVTNITYCFTFFWYFLHINIYIFAYVYIDIF